MLLIPHYKTIKDLIHGLINISNIAIKIIDTKEFQRLRYLYQLGTCRYVFPSANHTRFEHSIGTYFLTSKILSNIREKSNRKHLNICLSEIPELKEYFLIKYGQEKDYMDNVDLLDPYICELVKIAGLCHDLGHGPFSHIFDDVFIKNLNSGKIKNLDRHEDRSCYILERIIERDEDLRKTIIPSHLNFIKNLINPSKNLSSTCFIFQIISNNLNNIDVDKFDYIKRDSKMLNLSYSIDPDSLINGMKVIDNKICYPENKYYEVISLFKTRYRLHREIYSDKTVMSIQIMINEMMTFLNEVSNFYNYISDIDRFVNLTDEFIISKIKILFENKENFNEVDRNKIEMAEIIWEKINNRHLYKHVLTFSTPTHTKVDENTLKEFEPSINLDEIILQKVKIGFISGSYKNPINEIYFYNKFKPEQCNKIDKYNKSFDVPKSYQEILHFIYLRRYEPEILNKLENIKKFLSKS